jgi:hypothetical protein
MSPISSHCLRWVRYSHLFFDIVRGLAVRHLEGLDIVGRSEIWASFYARWERYDTLRTPAIEEPNTAANGLDFRPYPMAGGFVRKAPV